METQLNEDHLLAQFDRLVDEGMVVYSGDRTITVSDKGLSVRFRPPAARGPSICFVPLIINRFPVRIPHPQQP